MVKDKHFLEAENSTKQTDEDRIRVGTAIIKDLSTSFYPNIKMIFDELMTNSRDAMATTVNLYIGTEEITIEDDGEGMTKEELLHFFYIAHSSKPQEPVKRKGKLTREIIGKFGIGKLSMYQLCRSFQIISWKEGMESKASFDFGEFEKREFVDDFQLKIEEHKKTDHGNGTKIILRELKQYVNAMQIKRHLVLTMPLSSDFKILISGTGITGVAELRSEDVLQGSIQKKFPVDEIVDDVGKVTGNIYYKNNTRGQDFGVFIRVLGRLVNTSDPHNVINFASLTSAQQFDKRIYVDLNVDGLNDALQTNRAGFVVDHPTYIAFVNWLKKTLNKCSKQVGSEWREEREEIHTDMIKDSLSNFSVISNNLMHIESKEKYTKEIKPLKEPTRNQKEKDFLPEIKKEKTIEAKPVDDLDAGDYFIIKDRKFKIDVLPLSSSDPEAVLDKSAKKIIINSIHPLYLESRSQGGIWGIQYHALRAILVLVALESSNDINEFKKLYDALALNSQDVVLNMKKRLIK